MKMYRPHRLCPRDSKPKESSLYRSLCVSILCMFLSTVMLVGTTFAWFHSSATSAVSTITAGGLDVSTSYITQNTAKTYADTGTSSGATDGVIPDTAWIRFDGNGGNLFGSVPFSSNNPSQVVFLKLENKGATDATYRFALNLVDVAASADNSEAALRYGYVVLNESISQLNASFFGSYAISADATLSSDAHIEKAEVSSGGQGLVEDVTAPGTFFVDAITSHGYTDKVVDSSNNVTSITYGGNLCVVSLPHGSVKYVAVALFLPNSASFSSESIVDMNRIQLSMTVSQFGMSEPLLPNRIGQEVAMMLSRRLPPYPASNDEDYSENKDTEDVKKESEESSEVTKQDEIETTGKAGEKANDTGDEQIEGKAEQVGDTVITPAGTPDAAGTLDATGTSDTSGGGDTTVTENGSET